jgi:hypothetical protein
MRARRATPNAPTIAAAAISTHPKGLPDTPLTGSGSTLGEGVGDSDGCAVSLGVGEAGTSVDVGVGDSGVGVDGNSVSLGSLVTDKVGVGLSPATGPVSLLWVSKPTPPANNSTRTPTAKSLSYRFSLLPPRESQSCDSIRGRGSNEGKPGPAPLGKSG